MKETLENVNELYSTIEKLLNRYDSLKVDNKKIKQNLDLLQKNLNNKEKDYTELKKKYESLKLVKSLSSKGESVLAKKKIRKMIDDIDNCILNLMG